MKALRYASFILCLLGWSWWGWHYGYPVAMTYLDMLESRQGWLGAHVSFWLTLMALLWVYYGMAMNLKRAINEKRAPIPMQVLGYTLVLPPGLFLDWIVNMVFMTFISGKLPGGWLELVTGRLESYASGKHGRYRLAVSDAFGTILHALDPRGYHYKRRK